MEIKNLNLFDEQIDKINLQIETEIAKGTSADSDKLFDMICAIHTYYHGNASALHRTQKKIRSNWADQNHPELINIKKNKSTYALQSTSGAIEIAGAIFTVAGALAGVDAGTADNISKLFGLFSGGIGKLGSASQTLDQSRSMGLEYAIQKEQTEMREDLDSHQSSKNHESEALRRMKEAQDARANTATSVIRALGN